MADEHQFLIQNLHAAARFLVQNGASAAQVIAVQACITLLADDSSDPREEAMKEFYEDVHAITTKYLERNPRVSSDHAHMLLQLNHILGVFEEAVNPQGEHPEADPAHIKDGVVRQGLQPSEGEFGGLLQEIDKGTNPWQRGYDGEPPYDAGTVAEQRGDGVPGPEHG